MAEASVVVIGGTGGLGFEVARHYQERGRQVVISGRTIERAHDRAAELGSLATGLQLDLSDPAGIADALKGVGPVARLVLSAIDRDHNPLDDYSIDRAIALTTMKLVGYTEAIRTLGSRMTPDASVVLFGGRAKDRPYPGSTTVTTVNGGVTSLINTLALQMKPIRFNAIHPGIVGDSPYWVGKQSMLDAVRDQTPTGRLVTTSDVVEATVFLLENSSMNGTNVYIDGGWMLM